MSAEITCGIGSMARQSGPSVSLEQGLTDARHRLAGVRALLARDHSVTEMTARASDVMAAIGAVSFAASTDPALPALSGVLFDYEGETLRLVASDRYRLAVATVITRNQRGPAARLIAPIASVDELALAPDEDVRIVIDGCTLTIGATGTNGIDAVFPDYQRLLRAGTANEVIVDTADLIERLNIGPTRTMIQAPLGAPHEVSVVILEGESIRVIDGDHPEAVGLNRRFSVEALGMRAGDHVIVAMDGPESPLAILDPDRPGDVRLVMPTRLH